MIEIEWCAECKVWMFTLESMQQSPAIYRVNKEARAEFLRHYSMAPLNKSPGSDPFPHVPTRDWWVRWQYPWRLAEWDCLDWLRYTAHKSADKMKRLRRTSKRVLGKTERSLDPFFAPVFFNPKMDTLYISCSRVPSLSHCALSTSSISRLNLDLL